MDDLILTCGKFSMPFRPVLSKGLTIRSNATGTKADVEEALRKSASGKIIPEIEILKLRDLNEALDRLQAGKVLGKLVVDLSCDTEPLKPSTRESQSQDLRG